MLTDFLPGCCGIQLEDTRAARLSKWISVGFGLLCLALVFVVAQLGAVLQVKHDYNRKKKSIKI
jgi:hypothetical protein